MRCTCQPIPTLNLARWARLELRLNLRVRISGGVHLPFGLKVACCASRAQASRLRLSDPRASRQSAPNPGTRYELTICSEMPAVDSFQLLRKNREFTPQTCGWNVEPAFASHLAPGFIWKASIHLSIHSRLMRTRRPKRNDRTGGKPGTLPLITLERWAFEIWRCAAASLKLKTDDGTFMASPSGSVTRFGCEAWPGISVSLGRTTNIY